MTDPPRFQSIALHADAPDKPLLGAPCNGCGVCCAAEPCAVARLFLHRRRGRCPALVWQQGRYRCGLVLQPCGHLRLPRLIEPLARRLFARWIAADRGCDSDAEVAKEPAARGPQRPAR